MELLKAFALVAAFLISASLSVWGAMKLDALWILFIIIPLLIIIFKIIFISSTVSIKCKNCKKEIGVQSGGFASLWLAEKPKKCQWCGHENV